MRAVVQRVKHARVTVAGEETGRIDNFAKAAGWMDGPHEGIFFNDSDVYKIIEGAAYSLMLHPDPALDAYLDKVIALIAAAQEPDGYLYTARTNNAEPLRRWFGAERWERLQGSHELYNAGHLYEAAAAHFLLRLAPGVDPITHCLPIGFEGNENSENEQN